MNQIHIIPGHERFLDSFVSHFFDCMNNDLSRTAVVFPGRRPFLYFNKLLSEKFKGPFFPVRELTMADLIEVLALEQGDNKKWEKVSPLDATYMIVKIIQEEVGPFDRWVNAGIATLFPWAEKIFRFIDQMDKEAVPDDRVRILVENAKIGFEDVPSEINAIFRQIIAIRSAFHQKLAAGCKLTTGTTYLKALKNIREEKVSFPGIDRFLFSGLFALTGVEKEIIRKFWRDGKAEIVWNAFPEDYPHVLKPLYDYFSPKQDFLVIGEKNVTRSPAFTFHAATDMHSEALTVRDILNKNVIKETAVVCPAPETLFPVLTFAVEDLKTAGVLEDFNISLRYPLSRSSLFGLVKKVISIQRRVAINNGYFHYKARDYLRIVSHPFVKNIEILGVSGRNAASAATRALRGDFPSGEAGGCLVHKASSLRLDHIEEDPFLLDMATQGSAQARVGLAELFKALHDVFFRAYERADSLEKLCKAVSASLDFILQHSSLKSYILAGELFKSLFQIIRDLSNTEIAKATLGKDLVASLFLEQLSQTNIPFSTQPLQDLEIIGMLETRALSFKNLIILDVQEGILPSEKKTDPLIPMSAYQILGLPDNDSFQEMESYYFHRLVYASENVHLVWIDDAEHQRSRYVEKLIWNEERSKKQLGIVKINRFSLPIRLISKKNQDIRIQKDPLVMKKLQEMDYSPTAIDLFRFCRLKFYYEKILGLKDSGDVSDGLEADEKGIIIHRIMQKTFEPFLNQELDRRSLEAVKDSLSSTSKAVFKEMNMTGEQYLFSRLVDIRLNSYLETLFKHNHVFKVIGLEQKMIGTFHTGKNIVKIRGVIDRVDKVGPGILIIDYKTGSSYNKTKKISFETDLDNMDNVRKVIPSFQLPIYISLYTSMDPHLSVENMDAELVFLQDRDSTTGLFPSGKTIPGGKPFLKKRILDDFYYKGLSSLVDDMLDPESDFRPYLEQDCENCPFQNFCGLE